MKKRLWIPVVMAAFLSSSLTVCAAPQYMADGAVFDPEWYLEQNPDVAAGWFPGTSVDALYGHYTMYGANEGRKPYNEATLDLSAILPYQGAEPAVAENPSSSKLESTSPQNVPVGTNVSYTDTYTEPDADPNKAMLNARDLVGYGNGWSRTYRYTFTDDSWVGFTLDDTDANVDGHAYVSEVTDVNGVTYCEYKRGANAFVMNMMAAYMAQNPDSAFSVLVQKFGSQFVVVSADVLYDDVYDYDWNCGIIGSEPEDSIYMFVNTIFLDDDPDYVANSCMSLFEYVGENYSITESEE